MKNFSPNPWEVELQCPQCGAPVLLEEADRILTCAFCRVRLLLIYPEYPRYYLEPYQDQKPDQERIYVPYWRFKGIAYAGLQPQGENRVVDVTFLADEIPFLPPHLGLQARAFKLRLLPSQKKGRFIQPHFSFKKCLPQITGEQDSFPDSEEIPAIFRQTFIGETISLVYAPVFIKEGSVYDGLGDRLLGNAQESDFEKFPAAVQEEFRQVQFIPVICPYCGSDLQGEKDTYVLLCRNCDRVWEFSQGELKKISFGIIEALGERPPYYIPFWRIRTRITGWPLNSYNPLIRGTLHQGNRPGGEEKEEFFFWLPAFKISPSVFLTISKAVSFRQPFEYPFPERVPKGPYYPVTLPWEQAADGLNAVAADIVKTHFVSDIPPIMVEALDHLLFFIPFHLQGSELVQEEIALGINKNALHFGRFL